MRSLIEQSLGDSSGFALIGKRKALLDTARSIGICAPITKSITSEQEFDAWFDEGNTAAVVKKDGTWGGEGVAIAQSALEAKEAYYQLSRPSGFMTAWKRLLVNGDPLAFWNWSRYAPPSLVLQQYIEGQPANSMLACWQGRVLSMMSVAVLASEGTTGAAFLVQVIENERMERDAEALADRLQLSGFYGLDYIIENSTRVPYLIEVNPRCTQLGHLPLADGRDLASFLCEKLTGESYKRQATSITGRIIGFYPQIARWAEQCSLSEEIYFDVPQNQPRLLTELMLPNWPDRQWIARVYHYFFPPQVAEPSSYQFECHQQGGRRR